MHGKHLEKCFKFPYYPKQAIQACEIPHMDEFKESTHFSKDNYPLIALMNKTNFHYDDNFCLNKLTFEKTFCNLSELFCF